MYRQLSPITATRKETEKQQDSEWSSAARGQRQSCLLPPAESECNSCIFSLEQLLVLFVRFYIWHLNTSVLSPGSYDFNRPLFIHHSQRKMMRMWRKFPFYFSRLERLLHLHHEHHSISPSCVTIKPGQVLCDSAPFLQFTPGSMFFFVQKNFMNILLTTVNKRQKVLMVQNEVFYFESVIL